MLHAISHEVPLHLKYLVNMGNGQYLRHIKVNYHTAHVKPFHNDS